MSIDWGLPLETDEETPIRCVATPDGFGRWHVRFDDIIDQQFLYLVTGRPATGVWSPDGRKIRNVRTVDTSRDDAFRRMEALIRRVADHGVAEATEAASTLVEAREIVKLLPAPPVGPLLIKARKLVADAYHQDGSESYKFVIDGGRDNDEAVCMALAGLQHDQPICPTPGMRDLILRLIERAYAGGPHAYRCDPLIRELAESVARTLGMNP